MKLLINKSITFFFLLTFVFSLTSAYAGINCSKVLKTRTGTVMAGGPAKTTLTPTGNSITVKVAKTSGRAQTIVNIYVNNVRKSYIEFNNGNYTNTKSKTISGVRGKSVRIEIVNQSVGNKFGYKLTVTGVTNNLGSGNANLAGQGQKTITFSRACKNKVTIKLTRTGGRARANVFIYKNGSKVYDGVIDKTENGFTKVYSGANNATYKVVVKNVSVGNFFKFTALATQKD